MAENIFSENVNLSKLYKSLKDTYYVSLGWLKTAFLTGSIPT